VQSVTARDGEVDPATIVPVAAAMLFVNVPGMAPPDGLGNRDRRIIATRWRGTPRNLLDGAPDRSAVDAWPSSR
jgi:hypothetical protein